MTRLNTRLSSHVEQQDKVIEDHKKQLKLFRDRERREKEAADRARKELEEFEDVKNNLLNLPDGQSTKKVGFQPASKRNSTAAAGSLLRSISESSADNLSVMKLDTIKEDEVPSYKRAIRQ